MKHLGDFEALCRSLKPVFPSCWCHLLLGLGSNRGWFERRSWGVLPAPELGVKALVCRVGHSHRAAAQIAPTESRAPPGTDPETLLRAGECSKSLPDGKMPIQKNSTNGIFVCRAGLRGPVLPHAPCASLCAPNLLRICILSDPFSLGQATWTLQLPPAPQGTGISKSAKLVRFSCWALARTARGQCWGPGPEPGDSTTCVITSEAEQKTQNPRIKA